MANHFVACLSSTCAFTSIASLQPEAIIFLGPKHPQNQLTKIDGCAYGLYQAVPLLQGQSHPGGDLGQAF